MTHPGTWSYWVEDARARAGVSSTSTTRRTRVMSTSEPESLTDQESPGASSDGSTNAASTSASGTRNSAAVCCTSLLFILFVAMAFLSGCRPAQLGPGFAPDPELYVVAGRAIAAWNEHGAGLYLDEAGTPIRLIDDPCVETNKVGCASAVTSPDRGVIDITSHSDETGRYVALLHELCHVIAETGDHPDATEGVCSFPTHYSDDTILAVDLEWTHLTYPELETAP